MDFLCKILVKLELSFVQAIQESSVDDHQVIYGVVDNFCLPLERRTY